jgi:hypothetical protein
VAIKRSLNIDRGVLPLDNSARLEKAAEFEKRKLCATRYLLIESARQIEKSIIGDVKNGEVSAKSHKARA